MPKKTLVNLICKVNSSSIKTKTIDGDKHYIVPSATLPDNIVMNGGLYTPEEIEKGYKSLEGVPAPASHPMIDNKYVSARDVRAINKFHVGAYVTNVERKDGRVFHDTVINERVAMQTEIGKKLVDAINKGDPIHTSTGVFLVQDPLDEPMIVNEGPSKGKEYSWIARNLHHDHQALLLNETGAATPEEGVGMMVNSSGEDEEFEVMFINMLDDEFGDDDIDEDMEDDDKDDDKLKRFISKFAKALGLTVKSNTDNTPDESVGDDMKLIKDKLTELGVNHEGLSDDELLLTYNKAIISEQPQANSLTAEQVADIFDQRLAANKLEETKAAKTAIVDQVIATSKDYTEDDKEMLLNTDERILKSFLPKPQAAALGYGQPLPNSESTSLLNMKMEGEE